MLIKKFIKDYLSFSRKDRIGVISLILLILIIYFLPYLARKEITYPVKEIPVIAAGIDSLNRKDSNTAKKKYRSNPIVIKDDYSKGDLFRFDPNQLDAQGWAALGLSEKRITTILNYRTKGGKFRSPEDLKKIWGLPPGFYERVKDYMVIDVSTGQGSLPAAQSVKPERKKIEVGINTADTSAFIDLPGIGHKLAGRIVSFREKLGGFYSVEQVSETFGIADSVFQMIKPFLHLDGEVKKFSINTVSIGELQQHPYFRYKLAKAIIAYRNQHGPFQSLEELKKLDFIDDKTFEKLREYLKL